jgi:alkyl sulfatase BDS1-like metallo-beta-lactamase superfamily hydrolase
MNYKRLSTTAAVGSFLLLISQIVAAQDHFNSKGVGPSEFTAALQTELRQSLPFEDDRDFEESRRGFIAEPDSRQILAASGRVVWDMTRYDFLLNGEDYDSIHPSLQRQATLNMNFGLYEVVPDFIYQVRGFDLANMAG